MANVKFVIARVLGSATALQMVSVALMEAETIPQWLFADGTPTLIGLVIAIIWRADHWIKVGLEYKSKENDANRLHRSEIAAEQRAAQIEQEAERRKELVRLREELEQLRQSIKESFAATRDLWPAILEMQRQQAANS